MKRILIVSGSSRKAGSTAKMIELFTSEVQSVHWTISKNHFDLPLFDPEAPETTTTKEWESEIESHDAVFFITPEYIHNMPAVLKSALEWLTKSGVLSGKKVLACTYTPHAPRGEKALESLEWSLKALDCNILVKSNFYHEQFRIGKSEGIELIKMMVEMV